ncbi:MAG: DNA polymerase III subunit beta [Alphaproteobacteria bacterium MarineAlpha9_Bin6]|nr:MAG: DNA polymerase III subunit beta [Alphaproteobacteria bacterium MarineAlpha9_Bin6]
MKLTIERSALLISLQHVQSVVERRNTIPILSNVQLTADGSELGLMATDMDIWVYDKTPAEISQNGTTTAPAHMLFDIVRKLPDGSQVELDTSDGDEQLTLRSGQSLFTLACLPVEDFPATSHEELACQFQMPAPDLRQLIDKTRFAISTEETRYYLNGIYLHGVSVGEVPALRAVATDGHRLARVEVDLPDGAAGMPGVILPRKAVLELRKLLEAVGSFVEVALSETKIRVTVGAAVLTSKLIDGTFPDYQRVIPEGNNKIMKIDGHVFAEAVDRVSTVSSDKSRAIKLSLRSGKLVLSASSPDRGSASEELPVDYDSDDIEIGFNSRYVLDMTEQIEGDSMRFEMEDGASPTVIVDGDDLRTVYVLMPMRV